MSRFIGRQAELEELTSMLTRVRTGEGKPGKAVLMRGRRRIGKSRLVEEFIHAAGVPSVYFAASTRGTREELSLFTEEVLSSDLPNRSVFTDVNVTSWDAALRLLAATVPQDGPSIVVIDELPYLTTSDPGFEGTLQKMFDRELSRRPVLFIGVGSDLAMMEALNAYGRPFHQRASEMIIPPLTPAEVADMLGQKPAQAFDAYVVTGGLPMVCEEWRNGESLRSFLKRSVNSPTSALLVSGERSLSAEFPSEVQARQVLDTIGTGERTFAAIARQAGLRDMSLKRSLDTLMDKRIVVADVPLSVKPSKEKRYRVADPYLRFWLRYLGPSMADIERSRGDLALARIERDWTSYRGRACEPIVRESVGRLSGTNEVVPGGAVGSYWTRSNDPEIDVVVADCAPLAKKVIAVGSIKWLERSPFDGTDAARLAVLREKMLGDASGDVSMFAVTRSGCTAKDIPFIGPADLLDAWRV